MTAIDRLAKRLTDQGFDDDGAVGVLEIARFIYEDYLPSQLIGMKGAAALLGLASSNTLTMRLARGHDLGLAVHVDGNRITTVDAVEAYGEGIPRKTTSARDDDTQRSEAS